jgi:hypothetical protein
VDNPGGMAKGGLRLCPAAEQGQRTGATGPPGLVAGRRQRVEQRERSLRRASLGQRGGTGDLHPHGGRKLREQPVKGDDGLPVGAAGGGPLGMHGLDGGFQLQPAWGGGAGGLPQ